MRLTRAALHQIARLNAWIDSKELLIVGEGRVTIPHRYRKMLHAKYLQCVFLSRKIYSDLRRFHPSSRFPDVFTGSTSARETKASVSSIGSAYSAFRSSGQMFHSTLVTLGGLIEWPGVARQVETRLPSIYSAGERVNPSSRNFAVQ